ncbi:hypothetical protein [Paramaledivibacter caminithermalis]|uniref:Cch helix turn helix domain-containing protein n=1 Tax=Paramaledivibacter caminithermalis (strain DSM 15212 / CIP 107654 / DViRD3) TaxID=1121301 RepID=A0A1M6NAK0_PARC5|nr:hypothetical protein [Paramaledivibacter caminithermalis]SHJ92733.1 hypothetical protein SAMN02745912_01635 [Paramaledivibacter caminithermalis DSM 15212]
MQFGKALIEIGKDKVIEFFRSWVDKCFDKMDKEDKFSKRLSKPMALIMTSAEIAKENLGIELNIEKILEFLINSQRCNMRSKDIGLRAYEYFLELYTIHNEKFVSGSQISKNKSMPKEIWGKYIYKKNEDDEVLILPSVFKKIMDEGGFEDTNVVLSKWREKGYLDCDNNRFTRKRSIMGSSKRVYVVRIINDFFSKEENEEAEKAEQYKIKKKIVTRKQKIKELFDKEGA